MEFREVVTVSFVSSHIGAFWLFIIIITLVVENCALANVELVSNYPFPTTELQFFFCAIISLCPSSYLIICANTVSTWHCHDHAVILLLSYSPLVRFLSNEVLLLLKCKQFFEFFLPRMAPYLSSPSALFSYLFMLIILVYFYCLVTYIYIYIFLYLEF